MQNDFPNRLPDVERFFKSFQTICKIVLHVERFSKSFQTI